jgi:hypothetical protein
MECPFKKDFGIEEGCLDKRSPYTKYLMADSGNDEQKCAALEMAMYSSQFVRGGRQSFDGDLDEDFTPSEAGGLRSLPGGSLLRALPLPV